MSFFPREAKICLKFESKLWLAHSQISHATIFGHKFLSQGNSSSILWNETLSLLIAIEKLCNGNRIVLKKDDGTISWKEEAVVKKNKVCKNLEQIDECGKKNGINNCFEILSSDEEQEDVSQKSISRDSKRCSCPKQPAKKNSIKIEFDSSDDSDVEEFIDNYLSRGMRGAFLLDCSSA